MPADVPSQPTETCPGCGAVLVPVPDGGPRHPGASASCARLYEVTLRGLREEADAAPGGDAVVALADAAYDAQHPVAGSPEQLRAALDRLGARTGLALTPPPHAWRTTIADVAADLDVIDLQVLVESWARAVSDDWATVATHRG
ncbi:DUF5946 family protein [Blastococcus litoris]|uniref:DUF5946 family protein n=1 Tax=Blastococcus litoris TaxID=2171622 RepID=UPI000E3099AB|nr:DUF5946 family protein [Blastococcus litoris]